MTDEKIYTKLAFCFEVEIIGKCRKLKDSELAELHSDIKGRLEDYLLNFKLKSFPDFDVNEVGENQDFEDYVQVED
jgi:hypothetical protein